MRKTLSPLCALGLLLSLSTVSRADLIFNFDKQILSGRPGDTLTFTGSVINLNGPTLFLTSDSYTLDGIGLTLDDSPFLLNAPPSLDSGDSYTGPLFTVTIDPTASPQNALGEFNILGGANEFDQNLLGGKEFQVTVVPEPGSPVLLASLLGTAALGLRNRRRRARGGRA